MSDDAELTPAVLGQRIRDAIEKAGITQKSVAEAAGIDPAAMSRTLAGQRNLSSLELALICETLGVSPLALLGGARPARDDGSGAAAARVRFLVELDVVLTEAGLPARAQRWPFTLLDRAIEAYVRGDISIRPVARILGADADRLLDQLPRTEPPRRPEASQPPPVSSSAQDQPAGGSR